MVSFLLSACGLVVVGSTKIASLRVPASPGKRSERPWASVKEPLDVPPSSPPKTSPRTRPQVFALPSSNPAVLLPPKTEGSGKLYPATENFAGHLDKHLRNHVRNSLRDGFAQFKEHAVFLALRITQDRDPVFQRTDHRRQHGWLAELCKLGLQKDLTGGCKPKCEKSLVRLTTDFHKAASNKVVDVSPEDLMCSLLGRLRH